MAEASSSLSGDLSPPTPTLTSSSASPLILPRVRHRAVSAVRKHRRVRLGCELCCKTSNPSCFSLADTSHSAAPASSPPQLPLLLLLLHPPKLQQGDALCVNCRSQTFCHYTAKLGVGKREFRERHGRKEKGIFTGLFSKEFNLNDIFHLMTSYFRCYSAKNKNNITGYCEMK